MTERSALEAVGKAPESDERPSASRAWASREILGEQLDSFRGTVRTEPAPWMAQNARGGPGPLWQSPGSELSSDRLISRGRLGYVPALDGVRAIAIAAVTGLHFFGLSGGNYGVDLFFVLSGFLITTLLLEQHEKTGSIELSDFYLRRARRLLPALVTLLLAVAIVGSFAYRPSRLAEILAAGGFYAANVVRAAAPGVLSAGPLSHLWSLAMEEQFYLLWPIALVTLLHRRVDQRRVVRGLALLFIGLVVIEPELQPRSLNTGSTLSRHPR